MKYLTRHPAFPMVAFVITVGLIAPLSSTIADETRKFNVLILYADDLGFGDLEVQNLNSKIPTPNLNQLASQGTRFTDGHSSSGICTPSRYALLTGRHHWRDFHGIVEPMGGSVFKPERLTMPEMFQRSGYTTTAIGKWHLGWDWEAIRQPDAQPVQMGNRKVFGPEAYDWSQPIPDGPLAHGFDSYFGDTVINFPPYCWIENDRVQTAPDKLMDTRDWKTIKEGNWECRPGPMISGWDPYQNIPVTTQRGVDFIKAQTESDQPFFLYFAFPSPHAPIIPNDQFDGKSEAGAYGDFVFETDDACGRLLKALEESGQASNTIVIFSADNGPEHYAYARDKNFDHWSAEPFRGLKRDIYEGGHHVPFLIKWPGITKPGSVCDALVSQVDLMATLSAYVDFDLPADAAEDSHDLLPLLKDDVASVRETMIHNTQKGHYAIRDGDWLLVDGKNGYVTKRRAWWEKENGYPVDDDGKVELYNLNNDVGQRKDLSSDPANDARILRMKTLIKRIREQGYTAPRLNR